MYSSKKTIKRYDIFCSHYINRKKTMAKKDFIDVLARMDRMIRRRSTGSPVDFAGRLFISVRSLYNYLSVLKELGAPLQYSRTSESYFYKDQGRFVFEFEKQVDSDYAI